MSKSVLLLQTLEMLRTKPGITVQELAVGLGRSERTVYRYLSDLACELDVPVHCQDGAYRLAQPMDVSLERHYEKSWAVWTGNENTTVRVRFSPRVAPVIRNNSYVSGQTIEDLEDGHIILSVTVARTHDIGAWILSYGAEAEALEPEDLRDRLRCAARNVLRLYEPSGVAPCVESVPFDKNSP